MDMAALTDFLMWCTILNFGLLVLTSLMLGFAGDFVFRLHSQYFSMTRETFHLVFYLLIGVYKIFWMVFNLVPFVVLKIIA
jgi:hypothetical protein